ncbi:hypothetical protein IE81DRAFT_151678 [Ceraceosorus guamensis]|uniref:Mediator of RNA polymerase II transcription subunit 10 n=1 Tax=Ceraceosorus guamensis TaxID=1522189 RepID=A0A316W2F5_9BASI|nr:hypothetical protein IE81DRAFT_151678 [Ceraceosorus guamensis]PWN41865.1 hypothetical protein IE81DRAFT_151678 [Ceraceosorus guamensis]
MLSPNAPRQHTPLSPSPSPEPPGGAANGTAAGNGHSSGQALSAATHLGQAQNDVSSTVSSPHEQARQTLENCAKNAIAELYQLAVCTADVQPGQEHVVGARINQVIASLSCLSEAGSNQDLSMLIEPDVMNMLDRGRNPDLHTRTFMSELIIHNQIVASTTMALDSYYDRLADSVAESFPELAEDIERLRQVPEQSQAPVEGQDLAHDGEGNRPA